MSRTSTNSKQGFTLVELMAVMVIIAILLVSIVPALDNMLPSYRLTGTARTIASNIELAQSEAIAQRVEIVLVYNLDNDTFHLIVPKREPGEEEEQPQQPQQPQQGQPAAKGASDRPENDLEHGKPPEQKTQDPNEDKDQDTVQTRPTKLADDVTFDKILIGKEKKENGIVRIPFTHGGNDGAHSVGLKLKNQGGEGRNEQIWVRFNPMTRTIEYSDKEPEQKTLPADGSDP